MTRETCPGKSSNGKEKRPRSRREKISVPGFFRPSPEIKIPSPEKRIPGLGISRSGPGISRSGPGISRQTAQKSKRCRRNIAQKPRFVQKNLAEIRYLGLIAQKPRHENHLKQHNLPVFTSIS